METKYEIENNDDNEISEKESEKESEEIESENELFNECVSSKLDTKTSSLIEKLRGPSKINENKNPDLPDEYLPKSSTSSRYLTFEEMEEHRKEFGPDKCGNNNDGSKYCNINNGSKYMPCG